MGLKQLRHALRDEVMSARHLGTYAAARAREPAFAPHASIVSVFAVMNDTSEKRYHERETLTRALVHEQQERPGPFWASVLMVAYAPMLTRLRTRIAGDAFGRDDLDQMTIAAFLETVAQFRLDDRRSRIAMYLRQGTERAVFQRVRVEQRTRRSHTALEDAAQHDEQFDLFASRMRASPRIHEDERDELIDLFVERTKEHVSSAKLDVVLATYFGGERLLDYVDRHHAHLAPDARKLAYQRIKRERLRTLERLRPLFAAGVSVSPPVETRALPAQGAVT